VTSTHRLGGGEVLRVKAKPFLKDGGGYSGMGRTGIPKEERTIESFNNNPRESPEETVKKKTNITFWGSTAEKRVR